MYIYVSVCVYSNRVNTHTLTHSHTLSHNTHSHTLSHTHNTLCLTRHTLSHTLHTHSLSHTQHTHVCASLYVCRSTTRAAVHHTTMCICSHVASPAFRWFRFSPPQLSMNTACLGISPLVELEHRTREESCIVARLSHTPPIPPFPRFDLTAVPF